MGIHAVLEQAQDALHSVQIDPGRSMVLAMHAAEAARLAREPEAASVAERAVGLAAIHVKDLDTATRHLRSAIVQGRRAHSAQLVAEARMTLAFALNRQGRPRSAVREIDAALHALDSLGHARALAQRGAIFQQLGHLDEALEDYRVAVRALRRAEDLVWVQRVLSNRGVLHAFRHEFGAALQDLGQAEDICRELGLTLAAAFVQENLLLVQRRLGDVPRSLVHLARAEELYRSVDMPTGSLLLERSELMFSMRLFGEAREAAEQAVAGFQAARRQLNVPEARLMLARAAVRDGQTGLAVRQAEVALQEFTRQRRFEWVALAKCEVILARFAAGEVKGLGVRRLADASAEAEAAGWPATAQEVRLLAGRCGIGGRQRSLALSLLHKVSAGRARGPAQRRARGWLAQAILLFEAGDPCGGSRAAACGLNVIEQHCRTINAADLRASASGLGVELAQLGLRDALARRSARQVLAWAERGRARQLMAPTVTQSEGSEVTRLLAELRAVIEQAREATGAGKPKAHLIQRQVMLERAIRDASRRAVGSLGPPDACPAPAELAARLGDAVLVEFVELDGRLHALCVVEDRTIRYDLGAVAPVLERVVWLRFALTRLSRCQTTRTSAEAGLLLVRQKGQELDELLLRPLSAHLDDRRLVIVPTGALQSLPWSVLPSVTGRPVTLSPSAALWHRSISRAPQRGHVVAAAGPDLPGARAEAERVARIHGCGQPLVGPHATVGAVTTAMDGAALVHLAAHGTIRADNPLFSSLLLADGPLTVYDLERLPRMPDTVVLSACDAGRDAVLAGDELLGLSAAFLSRETRQVVASTIQIPDAATTSVISAFHSVLSRGKDVAAALSHAQAGVASDADYPAAFAAAAGFVCLGAGFGPLPHLEP